MGGITVGMGVFVGGTGVLVRVGNCVDPAFAVRVVKLSNTKPVGVREGE